MRDLIKQLIAVNMDEIVEKSLINCHVMGVHSIMLLDHPKTKIRMFVTTPDHELWKNTPQNYEHGLSAAFHPHHCDLLIHNVYGYFLNWIVSPGSYAKGSFKSDMYKYKSAITGDKIGFELAMQSCSLVTTRDSKWLRQGGSVNMRANQLHTIGVPIDEVAAWVVVEGAEDPNYSSIAYSNIDLAKQNFDCLYLKPRRDEIEYLLKSIRLF